MKAIEEDPHVSLVDLEREIGIPKTTVHRLLKDVLQYHSVMLLGT